MNLEQARTNMVEQQIRTWEVLDQDVLDLLYVVPREEFVPEKHRALAFSDLEIPIGEGERMWQPKLEARVLQELSIRRTDRVLEVGTGSGYFTALCRTAPPRCSRSRSKPALAAVRPRQPRAPRGGQHHARDRRRGARLASACALTTSSCSPARRRFCRAGVVEQLAPGGRLFAVVGEAPAMTARLVVATAPGAWHSTDLFETVIAPLVNAERPPRFRF